MAEIIGIGCTHYPPLITPDADRGFPVNVTLTRDARLPEALKNPRNWPEPMQQEYGDDQGLTAAAQHRARLVDGFRQVRQEILDFNPDFLVIFGDDQYENFREDIIPPLLHPGLRPLSMRPLHPPRRHRAAQCLERTPRPNLRLPRPPRSRPLPRRRTAGLRHRSGLCLPPAPRAGPGPRLHQHPAIPRL